MYILDVPSVTLVKDFFSRGKRFMRTATTRLIFEAGFYKKRAILGKSV
jgi:hypothetical protein